MILAFDIGGTAIKAGLVDPETGGLDGLREYALAPRTTGPALLARLTESVGDFSGYERIGVSTTGLVNTAEGRILYCSDCLPEYTGAPVRQVLERRAGVPVWVENDGKSAAVGEGVYGAGRAYDDFVCLTYGTSIGGALVIGKRTYDGARGLAGEFGHIPIHAGGRPCACGARGCYAAYASATALVRAAQAVDPAADSGRALFDRLAGNPRLEAVLEQWIDEVALGLVTLVHGLNPPCIVLGGGVMNAPGLAERIGARLRERVMPGYRDVDVRQAALGNTAGMRGAAWLAWRA